MQRRKGKRENLRSGGDILANERADMKLQYKIVFLKVTKMRSNLNLMKLIFVQISLTYQISITIFLFTKSDTLIDIRTKKYTLSLLISVFSHGQI